MTPSQPPILFVTATSSRLGKTTLACALIKRAAELGGHPVGIKLIDGDAVYDKSHDLISPDGVRLKEARSRPVPPLVVAPYRFKAGSSPLQATRRSGLTLKLDDFEQSIRVAAEHGDVLIVEVSGGLFTPLAEDGAGMDLAIRLKSPVVLMCSGEPGGESSGIATARCAEFMGAPLKGIIVNQGPQSSEHANSVDVESILSEQCTDLVYPTIPEFKSNIDESFLQYVRDHRLLERLFATPA